LQLDSSIVANEQAILDAVKDLGEWAIRRVRAQPHHHDDGKKNTIVELINIHLNDIVWSQDIVNSLPLGINVINLPRSGEKTTAVATADLPCVQQEVLSPGETYVTVRFIHDNVTGKSSKMSFENLRLLDRTTASFQLQLCADYKSGPHPDDLLKSGMWFRLGQITDIHSSGKLANNNSFLVTPIDDDAPKPLRIPWKYFSAVEMDADVYLREDDNDVYNDAY
jgi:hypothetical protein